MLVLAGAWAGGVRRALWAAGVASACPVARSALDPLHWQPPTCPPLCLAKPLLTGGICFVFVFQGD